MLLISLIFFAQVAQAAGSTPDSEEGSSIPVTDQLARKNGMSCSQESNKGQKEFAQIAFSKSQLPPVTATAMVLELSNGGKDEGMYCYKWPDGESTVGVSQSCKGWCAVPKPEGIWTPSLMNYQYQMAVDACKACDSDTRKCKGARLLKSGSDTIVISGLNGEKNIVQMGKENDLLIFQTTVDGGKDVSKPYLVFERSSEMRPDKKDSKGGFVNRSHLRLANAKTAVSISNERVPGSGDPAEGVRSCREITLPTDECKTLPELPNYTCSVAKPNGSADPTGNSQRRTKQ